jgi:hypothetical protein
MTSRRDVIKAGAMAAIAGAVPLSAALADPVLEQDKPAAGASCPAWSSPSPCRWRVGTAIRLIRMGTPYESHNHPIAPFFG